MIKSQRHKGFSLIEMLVYIAVLILMLAIIIDVVLSVVRSQRIIQSVMSIDNSAILGIERIEREVRQSDSVDIATSILSVNPGKLVLKSTDESGNPRTVEFGLSSGRLMFKENGIEEGALTEARAEVTSLIFRRFASSTIEGIRVEMTIESGTSTNYRTETFYSTSIVR